MVSRGMRKRIAIIHKEKCHPTECGNLLCAKLCPVNRAGSECITEDTLFHKARIDEYLCTGCGICPNRCPFGAIEIINLPETLNKNPIHRYGENMFELYSLPAPLFGQVTGVLGKNGIGKSTALRVMAGQIKPNLGDWTKEATPKEVVAYFKGTETQKFIERLNKGEITLSYKPQQVDLIPKQATGTVRELLTRVDVDKRLDSVVLELQLGHFLDTDISKISGGELQRVAIAAAVLKKANLYLLDEPSSYLDIKQRVNMARFVRTLATDTTSVMAIEHDLIILDFMTDSLNIMYGFEGAFGVVSGVKTTREGINSFLEGYLKEENVRFRSHPLKFEKVVDTHKGVRLELVAWTDLSKELGHFTLGAAPGVLYKGEIIGILGENGIGKTTFMKMLAGIEKADSGSFSSTCTVAYKPQYLETTSDVTVLEFLGIAIEKYPHSIIKPLDIERLFDQKLSSLSGGQLQRVAIAHCLSQDAELFLLDEPSAYLDVEQRLIISKMIKTLAFERDMTILIIDHDLMFLDYVADKLMVFTGTPARNGMVSGPFKMEEGMNKFLTELDITLRRDMGSRRPRINKLGSVKDREQRAENRWYYS